MGVVYYSNYLIWFEIGRVEFLRRCGSNYKDIEKGGIALPVKHCSCDYFKSACYDDIVRIETLLKELTGASIAFKYNIYLYPGGSHIASGETKHVFISTDGKIQRAGKRFYDIFAGCNEEVIIKCREPLANVNFL